MMTFQSKKEKPRIFIFLLVPVIFFGWSQISFAAGTCTKVTSTSQLSTAALNAGYTAASWTGASDANTVTSLGLPGIITISGSSSFQPSGTLLGSFSSLLSDVWSQGDIPGKSDFISLQSDCSGCGII